ncbi:hypothetical protein CJU89_4577 [Yarrowia sp. B02]|nr:hypothetical protein CJU89_4577 [Yarrowia sp. B02]
MTLETAGAISSLKSAITAGTMPQWEEQRSQVQQLIKEICASYDPIKDNLVVNAVTGHQEDAKEQIERIVGLLDAPQFKSSPPFTLQRMAELLTEPFKFYPQNHLAKFLRALERVMLVSSSVDDYGVVSVDIHDVPTVEDGEKIKPDTGIVLTPIPWISDEDEAKLRGENTEDTVDDRDREREEDEKVKDALQQEAAKGEPEGQAEPQTEPEEKSQVQDEPKTETQATESAKTETEDQPESTESTQQESTESAQQETANISVEMADVSVELTHDVSVEMTDADLSAEMATHDVSNEAAQQIREAKNEAVQGDLLEAVEKHEEGQNGKESEADREAKRLKTE